MEDIKKEYIREINKLLNNCDDLRLIDLVFQIMVKSMNK